MLLDDEVASMLNPGPFSVVVCTRDAEKRPDIVRGWGARLLDDRQTVEVFVGREPARRLVENLRDNGEIAMAICLVTTYQTLQLKGICTDVGEPEAPDLERVRASIDGFVTGVAEVGMPPSASRGVAVSDVVRVRFRASAVFDQTPGPGAGRPR